MTQNLHQNAVHKKPDDPQTVRDLDPNVRQRRASDPEFSIWVGASAGTGKTKVLTDRVLRLLLPRGNGAPGTAPHRILGLTFTKAGAGEMALRINETLSHWAVMPESDLQEKLRSLLGKDPQGYEIEAARKLFAQVVDTPGGLNIMTIHAFCQSVLSRFPLEAGLPPYFKALDEAQAPQILAQARDFVLRRARDDKTSPLHEALIRTASNTDEERFLKLLQNITGERRQMNRLLERYFGVNGLYTETCKMLGLTPGQTAEDILREGCSENAFDGPALRTACAAMIASSGKTDQKHGQILADWLSGDDGSRRAGFGLYVSAFLTQSGTILSKLASKAVTEAHPDLLETLTKEAGRILILKDRMNAADSALLTRDLLRLGQAILERYDALKTEMAALDFDDLILRTEDLLNTEGMSGWVMFKLDQGLEHILIDEAQDTNPEQWGIIKALCEEFFAGKGAKDERRTVFTVGDEKQSIYSFQRASPEEFRDMKSYFQTRIETAKENWGEIDLNISFRSTESVLKAVDAVFAAPHMQEGLSLSEIEHHSFRKGQAGHVELWPLFESAETVEFDPWEPPVHIVESPSGPAKLAEHIAKNIKNWLDSGEILESRARPVRPGDILILVRTRTAFVNQLSRALKMHNIPVGGADRMVLNDQLAVQDLLAMAEFALLPDDDLTLACILKSPLIGFDEDQLFELAIDRGQQTLWDALKNSTHKDVVTYLKTLIAQAGDVHPYEFFTSILHSPCPADKRSGLRGIKKRLGNDAVDALDELLNAALNYEHLAIPSLQGFIHWQSRGHTEIKREQEEGGNVVRIMTVHGAKGLQAPIVILPDTTRSGTQTPGQADKRLLWPRQTTLDVPLWSPRKDQDFTVFTRALGEIDERLDKEYRRLLYVAMTRAEDRLYIAGYKTRRDPIDNCWYNQIKTGLSAIENIEADKEGILKLGNPQTKDPDRAKEESVRPDSATDLPEWLLRRAPKEPDPPAPLVPSRPSESEPAALSPLQTENTHRFRRGNLTHTLLEILPGLPPDLQASAANGFINRQGHDLPEELRQDIVKETLAILNNPEYSAFFGPGSVAEVPVTGLLPDGRLISGQIDRLYVTDDALWIIDYKTNRPSPGKFENVPEIYKKQMKAYGEALSKIYPGRQLHMALLWTDKPHLMKLPPDLL